MDSGNSGSMQSSSGGGGGADEEYDSRGGAGAESISSFLNSSSPHFLGSTMANTHHHHQPFLSHQPTLFDPSPPPHSQNLEPYSQSVPNPTSNDHLPWSRGLIRSDQSNYTNFGNITGLSSSPPSGLSSQVPFQSSSSPLQGNQPSASRPSSAQPDHQPKNPKKRTRASRRAPTTVLTTDTTNFRQMVQEFTGIPAAPFSGSTYNYSRRLDLFSTPPGSSSAGRLRSTVGHLDALQGPLYPLRPSAQKVHLSPFAPSAAASTMIDAIAASTTNNNTTSSSVTTSNAGPSSNNYPLSSDLGFAKNAQNLLNMQNQILTYHHHQQQQQQPLPIFATKGQGGLSNISIPSLDELGGMGHDHEPVNAMSSFDGNNGSIGGSQNNARSSSSSYKLNCSASSSQLRGDQKGLENVSSVGDQGTVGSWICPSASD